MAIDVSSMVWRMQRPFLRHGRLAWATLAIGLLVATQSVQLGASALRLSRQAAEPAVVAAVQRMPRPMVATLPLPRFPQRFELTREAIAAAAGDTSTPLKISFGYRALPEARLVRQTATFATQSRWSELGPLLDRLQDVHRAAYISRLRLSREQPDQPEIEAEVQLTIAYLDVPAASEAP